MSKKREAKRITIYTTPDEHKDLAKMAESRRTTIGKLVKRFALRGITLWRERMKRAKNNGK